MVEVNSTCIAVGRRIFYVFNLGIPVFLAYTGAMGLLALTSYNSDSTATVFQSIYMLLFAALLFIFEAVQICPCEPVDNVLKRNFGFFYGVFGKGDQMLTIPWWHSSLTQFSVMALSPLTYFLPHFIPLFLYVYISSILYLNDRNICLRLTESS